MEWERRFRHSSVSWRNQGFGGDFLVAGAEVFFFWLDFTALDLLIFRMCAGKKIRTWKKKIGKIFQDEKRQLSTEDVLGISSSVSGKSQFCMFEESKHYRNFEYLGFLKLIIFRLSNKGGSEGDPDSPHPKGRPILWGSESFCFRATNSDLSLWEAFLPVEKWTKNITIIFFATFTWHFFEEKILW